MSVALAPVHVHSDEADCLIALVGDIDAVTAPDLASQTIAAIADSTASRVTLDLSRVTFMDAAGLGLLVRIRHAALRRGSSVCLLGVPGGIVRLLGLGGLADTFGLTSVAHC